jgi:hypothetical protein
LPAILRTENAGGRDCHKHPLDIIRILNDGMDHHTSRTRLPFFTSRVIGKTTDTLPGKAIVFGTKQGPGISARINNTRLANVARLDMPNPLYGPFVIFVEMGALSQLPALPQIGRSMDITPVDGMIKGGKEIATARIILHMLNWPAGEMGAIHLPLLPFGITFKDKGTFAGTRQYYYTSTAFHLSPPFSMGVVWAWV